MKKIIFSIFVLYFVAGISFAAKEASLTMEVSNKIFSTKLKKQLEFMPIVANVKKVKEWSLTIFNEDESSKKIISGKDSLPKKILWDGKNDLGTYSKDGKYSYKFNITTDKGMLSFTKSDDITVDSVAPFVFIKPASEIYVIDNDKLDRNVNIYINCDDENGIDISRSGIVVLNSKGIGIRQFKFDKKIAELVTWDGFDSVYGSIVKPGNYTIRCYVYDKAGNYSQSEIVVSIILMPEDENEKKEIVKNVEINTEKRGDLIILQSDNTFEFDEGKIKPIATLYLNKIVKTLKTKYQKNKIYIEGHSDAGVSDDYDLRLSEKRAQAICNYLVLNGISKEKITTKGYGNKVKISKTKSEASMYKNRRVEIVIIKENNPEPDEK